MNENLPILYPQLYAQYGAKMVIEEVAKVLRFTKHDIRHLCAKKIIKPLGKPKAHSIKWYSTRYIAELVQNVDWLDKAVRVIQQHNDKR